MKEKQLTQAEELEILHPARDLVIAGETVTVREFSFLEGLEAGGIAAGIIRAIGTAVGAQGEDLDYLTIDAIFAAHADDLVRLLALATGRPADWVRALGDADGQSLALTFWAVNNGFFTRRLVTNLAVRHELARAAASESPNSTVN